MTIKDSGDHALEDNSCVVPGVPSVLHLKSYNVISFLSSSRCFSTPVLLQPGSS